MTASEKIWHEWLEREHSFTANIGGRRDTDKRGTAIFFCWSINNFTVIFFSMSENWFFPTHRQYHERHFSVRTPSWTAIALVGEVC
jgi:hypothetical protein